MRVFSLPIVRSLAACLYAITLAGIAPSLPAAERPGRFDLNAICDKEVNISGKAVFILEHLQDGDSLQLLLFDHESSEDFFAISLEHAGGLLGSGTYGLGRATAVKGSVEKSQDGVRTSGAVESGELIIEQSAEGILSGSLHLVAELTATTETGLVIPCSAGGSFSALPGSAGSVPAPAPPPGAAPPEGDGEAVVGDDTGEPETACPQGPESGSWSITAGKMTVNGIWTPLGGGSQSGIVQSHDGGARITADFAGIGHLVFEPLSGRWEFLTGRLYQATKLPSAFSEGIYWYLSCDSSTSMLSTTGIKESHRRGGPPHTQFHRWEIK